MTINQAFLYIESFTNLERNIGPTMRPYRLDRMTALLDYFDHPEDGYSKIHVAGSKGKGSTAAFISRILEAGGFKTGLYLSPHVVSYRERITLAGVEMPDEVYIDQIVYMKDKIESMDPELLPGQSKPTTFELLTLLSFLIFKNMECKWAVIETGIGGRLDATNVIHPVAAVITPIELEHTEVLGTAIPQIAAEKAGIIKQDIPVFIGVQKRDAKDMLVKTAAEKNAACFPLNEHLVDTHAEYGNHGTGIRLKWKDSTINTATLKMLGDFQIENAALACLVCRQLFKKIGISTTEANKLISEGLGRARLPGRMEVIQSNPDIILDGAHTPASVKRLCTSLARQYPQNRILLFGSVLGKNATSMAKLLAPHFESIIVSTPGTFKMSDPRSVYEQYKKYSKQVELKLDPSEALERALELAGNTIPILVTGSFYMVSEIRKLIVKTPVLKI